MNLGGYVLLAIPAVICLEDTKARKGKNSWTLDDAGQCYERRQKDVNALSCEAGRNLREDVTSLQDTVTDMQTTVNNQSDVIASILAILEEKQAAASVFNITAMKTHHLLRYHNPCTNCSTNSCTNSCTNCSTDCSTNCGTNSCTNRSDNHSGEDG
nr:hypothetical protein BaRGS_017392 [Batillaria attramentaria]